MRLTLLFATVLLFSCSRNKGLLSQPECPTKAVVLYKTDIQPLFDANCNTASCHSGSDPAGNLDLETGRSYAALNRPGSGYLDSIDPDNSVLYSMMTSASNPMPPQGKLSACDLQLIYQWMSEGARNN